MEDLIHLHGAPETLVAEPLVQHYLAVVNRALCRAQEGVVGRRAVAALEARLGGRRLGLRLFTDDPDEPHDFYTLCWESGQVHLVGRGKHAPEAALKLGRADMQDVLRRPEWYVRRPAQLILLPLQRRLRLATQILAAERPQTDAAADVVESAAPHA